MSVLVNVRVDEHVRDTWKDEAEKLGTTLSDFVKGAVDARLRAGKPGSTNLPPPFPNQTGISQTSQLSIARPTPDRKPFNGPDWKVSLAPKKKGR